MPTKDTGAGCICISYDSTGTLLVLLGEEKGHRRRAKPQWSHFAGRRESDEDLVACAAREFVEESIGIIPLSAEEAKTSDVRYVRQEIEKKSLGHIEHIVCGRGALCRNRIYILKVPYNESLADRFSAQRKQLLKLHDTLRHYQQLKKQLQFLSSLCIPGATLSDTCTTVALEPSEATGDWTVEFWDSDGQVFFGLSVRLDARQAEEACCLMSAWKRARGALQALPSTLQDHPAILVRKVNGRIVDAVVSEVYLEKLAVDWWTLDDIKRNSDKVKSYFAYLLPYALDIASAPEGDQKMILLPDGSGI